MKPRFFRLALAAVLVTSTAVPASAQVLTTYNNGDIFLGFRRAGTANTLAVNIGSARQFLTTAQGGTNDSTVPFKVRFGVVPGTSAAVTSMAGDLAAVFTSSWTNNPIDGTGVRWGVVGLSGNTSSGIPNYTARTLFVTRPRTAPGTPTSIPGDRLEIGDYDTFSSAFNSFVQGTGGSAFRNQQSTTNSSAAYIGAASGVDNWGTRVDEASEGSFGLGSGYEVEQTFGAFSGPTDSVLDFWISPNEGSTAIPENQNTYLGYFTLNTVGELTFTPAGSVTTPTITGFAPNFGPAGTSLVITGTGFTAVTAVTFNGASATNFTVDSPTQITATVPVSATTGKIAVSAAGGTATSTTDFTVTAPDPSLSTFNPLSGAVGTSVAITGANLSGASSVTFNGVSATNFTVDSATQITATVPVSATTGKIAVVTAGGTATSTTDFTVTVPVNPALTIYANGDIFLGFRRTGTADTLAVNLGSARQFLTTAQGGTNNAVVPFKVGFGVVPGGSTAVNNLAADLTAVFGSNWATNKADGSSVRWAVVGLSGNTSSGIAGYAARTLFVTRARTATNTPTIIPVDRLEIGDFDTFSSAFNSFVQGVGGGSYKNQFSTLNSSVAYIGAASDDNNWGTRINDAAEGSFGLGANLEVEQTFGSFSGPTDSVLDLWISPNEGSTTIPVNQNTYLGFFTLNNAGELTFTPKAATDPPTIASFAPDSGRVGTQVIITGTGLTGASSVTFNGTAATAFTANSFTQVTATVPAGATTGKIAVTTPNGSVTSTNNYTVTLPAPVISSATTASGTVGTAFSYNITANNSPTSFNATGLPAGLSVNTSTGAITGTPTTSGSFSVSLSATNATGTGTATLTLTVLPADPVISSATSASGKVGQAFNYQITASNSPTSFNATGLPAGLGVNTSTGAITGTPAASGAFTVSLSATNAGGTGTATLTLTVLPADPVISSATSASGKVGQAFSYQITANNSPTSFNATGLPAGLSVNTSTGAITGTPAASGAFTVSLSATNAGGTGTATLTINVALPAPTISSFTPGSGVVGTSVIITGTGFSGATAVTFNGVNATNFTTNNATQITATVPATATTGKIAVTTPNGSVTSTGNYTVTLPAPVISGFAPGSGTVGAQVAITGTGFTGATAVTFNGVNATNFTTNNATLITATVPAGATTGKIIVTTPNGSFTNSNDFSVLLRPVITSVTTATGRTDQTFTYNIGANNLPTAFSATGLPAGLSIDTATGVISGRPLNVGIFPVVLAARNAVGIGPNTTLTLTIRPPAPVITVPSTPSVGRVGQPFSLAIAASNSPIAFASTGLPAGLTINATTGVISGTPNEAGTFNVALSATNATGTGTATLRLTLNPPPPVITGDNATRTAIVGNNFSFQISASNSPTSFTATGLPPGLSLNAATGVIAGSPTRTGSFTVSLAATNASGTGRATLNLIVLAAPAR